MPGFSMEEILRATGAAVSGAGACVGCGAVCVFAAEHPAAVSSITAIRSRHSVLFRFFFML